jgi:hypothetical protein
LTPELANQSIKEVGGIVSLSDSSGASFTSRSKNDLRKEVIKKNRPVPKDAKPVPSISEKLKISLNVSGMAGSLKFDYGWGFISGGAP